jgi:arginine decarboxylase
MAATKSRRSSRASTRATSRRKDETPPQTWMPPRIFFTTGTGTHETQRAAMQRAMGEAGAADCNFVKVSSVLPPGCEIITREHGLRLLRPGNIVHAVIAEGETNEPHQRVTPAICWAQPDDDKLPGYLTEVEEDNTKGKSTRTATDEAGEALLTIIGEKLDAKVDAKKLWGSRGRDRRVRIGGRGYRVGSVAASAVGPEAEDGTQQYAIAVVLGIFV